MTEYVISYILPYFSVFAQTTYSTIHDNVWSIYNNRQYVKKKSDSANIIHPSPQYAVPVTKYDRKGYKARNRQLLLMVNSAIIVEEAKLKQRIDYSSLKGEKEEGERMAQPKLFLHLVWLYYGMIALSMWVIYNINTVQ